MDDLGGMHVDFLLNNEKVAADSKQIKADIMGVNAATQKAVQSTDNYGVQLSNARLKLADVTAQQKALNLQLKAGTIDQVAFTKSAGALAAQEIALKNQIQSTTQTLKLQGNALAGNRRQWNGLNNSVNQISRELPAFAVSGQIGILALSNNIPILADEIGRLKKSNDLLVGSGKKAIPIWKSVAGALISWQTAMSVGITLLTIYGREVSAWVGSLFKGKKAIVAIKASQEALNKAFESTEYKKAIEEVIDLRSKVQLAKDGMIEAEVVVNQYNKSLGKTAGEAKNLADVEQILIDKGDAYIEMMLFKGAALASIAEASKLVADNQKEQLKIEEEIIEWL